MKVERRREREEWFGSARIHVITMGLVAIAIGIASCAQDSSGTGSPATRSPSSAADSSPTASHSTTSLLPASSPSMSVDLPTVPVDPGRPHDASDVLTAMSESRRPGGVAPELQTNAIAAQVAVELWTWNGEPWARLTATGSCGSTSCTLEVIGSAEDSAGADTYSFSVTTADWQVHLVATDLHGYPPEIETALDQAARAALTSSELEGMALVGARWLPPPETGQYWLSYRSGGEEGSPGLDVLLDAVHGVVIESRQPG
jgi:hypothetical protein